MSIYSPNKLFIYKNCIKDNILSIMKLVGNDVKIMPVIKANAYGMGVANILSIIKDMDIEYLAVATVAEAVELRKLYTGKIMVLLQPFKEEIFEILSNDLIINFSDIEFLKKLNKKACELGKKSVVHLEVDTGMGRTGVNIKELEKVVKELKKLKNVSIDGVSTHFSSSSSDIEYTKGQIRKFNEAVSKLKENINTIKIVHACSSGGILNWNVAYYDMVRVGIMLYGYYPKEKKVLELKPAIEFLSKLSYIHYVDKGEGIGYNKTVVANKKMRVAIIPFGFADAFMGLESGKGYVIVKNHKAKIIAICMDTMIIDITDFNDIDIDDEVIVWDNVNITLDEWAEWTNTSNYEVLSILSDRIERVII